MNTDIIIEDFFNGYWNNLIIQKYTYEGNSFVNLYTNGTVSKNN